MGMVLYAGAKRNRDASSIFSGSTILPGLNKLSGSNAPFICRNAPLIAGPNCHSIHSPRHRPSPCSPLYAPLNLRTKALASSAIARIFVASPRRMSRMGRTCSVPTLACAYHVPRVPCFANTSVRLAVYSARLSSGTAQSSMKLTGLPSPFKLIMMLSPALRTSHKFFCGASSVIETTASGNPSVAISSMSCCSLCLSAALSSPENSTSRIASGEPTSAVRMVGANAGLVSDNSIIVRSTSSTAVGPSFTMCRAASIA